MYTFINYAILNRDGEEFLNRLEETLAYTNELSRDQAWIIQKYLKQINTTVFYSSKFRRDETNTTKLKNIVKQLKGLTKQSM